MARPTTKQELIIAADGGFEKLWKLIGSMPESVQNAVFSFEDRDKNLRDSFCRDNGFTVKPRFIF